MVQNLSLALSLMPQSSGGFNFATLYPGSGSGSGMATGMSPKVAIEQAEKNEAKQLEQTAKSPEVKRELDRYAKVVAKAKTLDDVLNDPVARKVFLTAAGLGDQVEAVGLAKKALMSDPTDEKSVAVKMSGINAAWLDAAVKFNFKLMGLLSLKTASSVKEVSENYVAEKRLDNLDAQTPGLGTALLFKKAAGSLDSTIKILGSGLGREVVTVALGIPKQIALQSLEAQTKAVEQRLDVKKLKDPAFVDRLVQRYLIQLNGGTSGITA